MKQLKILFISLIIFITFPIQATTQEKLAFQSVQDLFAAMSAFDYKAMRKVAWMESAVIIKQNDQWKIQMLHSTRLDKDKVPADIQWVEYNPNSPACNQ